MSSDHTAPSAPERIAPPVPGRSALRFFRLATAISWTLLILVLCWLPTQFVDEVEEGSSWFRIPNLDKVVHGGIFVVLPIVWLRLRAAPNPSPSAPRSSARPTIWMVILGGFALGVLTELGQLVPIVGRDAEVSDLVMDFIGVLIGVAIAPLVEPWIRFVERRLFREPTPELVPAEPVA